MLYIEIRWRSDGWYCNVYGDDCQHRYRQQVPSELGANDSNRVLQWAGEQWPGAALNIQDASSADLRTG